VVSDYAIFIGVSQYTARKEASVTQSILTQLGNLGWIVDERSPDCDVLQQRVKTSEQRKKLGGKIPDFTLYQRGTNRLLGVIEAKRPNEPLAKALKDAEEKYAKPLQIPLVFAYNDTYVETRYLANGRPLKLDGEDIRQFVDQYTALRFVNEGAEILSAPTHVQYSRQQLIAIFRRAANLLREAGLQAGLERFAAFSDILFLKLMDEVCELKLHAHKEPPIEEHLRWSHFKDMAAPALHTYLKDVVWKEMNKKYGSIFGESLQIGKPEIIKEIVEGLSGLNLTAADTDVKGDAFEYFLKNAYQGLSIKDLGEYFTPRNIVRTMVSMVNPQIGEKIYDPFCGTGGFLIESFKFIQNRIKPTPKLMETLENDTVWGSEITVNARVAKMNMILFGDGHSNIEKWDSLEHPRKGQFDIVLTNPPYSVPTRYGNLYPVDSSNGDAVCAIHCFDSLNATGRAAILVKEDFLSKGGTIGKVRDYILKNSKNFTVTSLPRNLFAPYTPTKTSIIYFEKAGKRPTVFFFVVKHVGHTLGTRKRSIKSNDLPLMLDAFNEQKTSPEITSCIVPRPIVEKTENSLWVYDYIEVIPPSPYPMEYMGGLIERSGERILLSENSNDDVKMLGVSNQFGIFENEEFSGDENTPCQKVRTGDLVYNPHRVNVGSVGLVTDEFDGGLVSGVYVIFRSKDTRTPSPYLLALMKCGAYKKVIEAYDTKSGAVRPNLTYDQLCRIKIPILPEDTMKIFIKKQKTIDTAKGDLARQIDDASDYLDSITREEKNPNHRKDFDSLLSLAAPKAT
jgi:type I restriction enzyme M protein